MTDFSVCGWLTCMEQVGNGNIKNTPFDTLRYSGSGYMDFGLYTSWIFYPYVKHVNALLIGCTIGYGYYF